MGSYVLAVRVWTNQQQRSDKFTMTFDLVYQLFPSKLSFLTQHDGVDDESYDVLRDEEGDGSRTLFRYHPSPESDGHLNLDGEQEGGRK